MERIQFTRIAESRTARGSLAAAFVLLLTAAAMAQPALTVKPITWNVIGLDSNDVNTGPNVFLVGARVTNTGTENATGVIAQLIWDSDNPLIQVTGPSALTRPVLGPGEHEDFYFDAEVTRSAAAYNTARRFHIEATADGLGVVSTPTPRELYVEKMNSQQRNSLDGLVGPTVLYLGRTYQFIHDTQTAPNGYNQLVSFIPFPSSMFRFISTDVTYTAPKNATNDQLYADGCGWDADPVSPTYLSCIGPPNYKKGKVGGDVHTVYTLQILGTGTADLHGVIIDYSGNSFHYTNDYNNSLTVFPVTVLPAPPPGFEELTYAVSTTDDELVRIDPNGFTPVGTTGAGSVKALAMAPGGAGLYGANGDQLGTLDTGTGLFTPLPNIVGTGNGSDGSVNFDDVTGLAFDPYTLKLYGTSLRTLGGSVLIQIDPQTGSFVPDAFGPGVDYVPIQPVAGLDQLDDIAIDPGDGQMYGAVSGSDGLISHLVKIDKTNGATEDVGQLTVGDMKGLSFSGDGYLRGTSGDLSSLPAEQQNRLWVINTATAEARPAYTFPDYTDYEGVSSMTSPANTVSGRVFRDDNRNGVGDGLEPGLPGATVRLYVDGNNSGTVDAGDTLIQTATTASDGTYSFTVGVHGNFVVSLDVDSVASAAAMTTSDTLESDFAGYGSQNTGRDFGVFPGQFTVSSLILWGDGGTKGVLETGDTVAYEISFQNLLKVSPLTVSVTGALPSGLSNLGFAYVPVDADVTGSTPWSLSVQNFTVNPNSTETIVATGMVCRSVADGTVLTASAGADWTGDGVADLSGSGSSPAVTSVVPDPATIPDFCTRSYTIHTVAGTGSGDYSGDGGAATNAQIYLATQIAVDSENNLYIADRSNHVVRKVDRATSTITTIAGIPHVRGYTGDGGPATAATLSLPSDVCIQGNNLYIAEMGNHVIRKVDLVTGIISTVVGNGTAGFSGDGGPATSAQLNAPRSVLVDVSGNIYIADTFNFAIRRVDAKTGIIDSILGTGGTPGHTADGQTAKGSPVEWVMDLAMTNGCSGTPILYFSEENGYNLIRRIVDGKLETVVGQLGAGDWGDCGPADLATLKKPYGIAFDSAGNLYIADTWNHKVRMVDLQSGLITAIAGTGTAGYNGDDQLGVNAELNYPTGVAVSSDNILYIADRDNQRIRSMNLNQPETVPTPPFPGVASGDIDTIAGTGAAGYDGDGADPRTKMLSYPGRIAVDAQGNVIVADRSNHRIRKIFTDWRIVTIAGTGQRGYSGDGGNAQYADLNFPTDVAVAPDGTVFFSDQYNHVIRRITPSGTISTVAGTGSAGFNGDGSALSTQLNYPDGLALFGNTLYISDWMNNRVRALDLTSGNLTTMAGTGATGRGDELVPALSTPLDTPQGLDVDPLTGNLFIAERGNNRIRCLTPGGTIFTWAGNGITGYSGDGGPALDGQLNRPMDVAVGPDGALYIAEYGNDIIRVVDSTGILGTLGGVPLTAGYAGDGGAATSALLNSPFGVALNSAGDLFISDRLNHAIRVIGH